MPCCESIHESAATTMQVDVEKAYSFILNDCRKKDLRGALDLLVPPYRWPDRPQVPQAMCINRSPEGREIQQFQAHR